MRRLLVLLILVAMFSTVVFAQEDDTPRIAVISAYAPELTLLLAEVENPETVLVNGVEFTTGQLRGNDVVLFLSGVSMVNAAMNTQLLLDNFNVTHIVFSGIAGGVNPDLSIGDVSVPGQWGQYLEVILARDLGDGEFAIPPWAQAAFPNFEMFFPQTVNVRTEGNPAGEEKFWFEVDSEMLEVAESIADSVELSQCTADNVCLDEIPQIVIGGNGVSGQAFVDNARFRAFAFATFEANVLDMESASSAMVAYANGVPFIAFRSLSDLAGGGPGENEIGTFFQLAADNSAQVVLAFLEAWAEAGM